MSEQPNRRVVIVGVPGVGKTTVVNRTVEKLVERKMDPKVVNYGTVMMEEATKAYKVKSRDEMRKLSIDKQRKLQVHAAEQISGLRERVVIIDTHLFIATREGFWPGMPLDVLKALRPTHLVLVLASPDEIMSRRERDSTRVRDRSTKESVSLELDAARSLLFASTLVSGCPGLIVANPENSINQAAEQILNAVI